jgi:hypothetical protein
MFDVRCFPIPLPHPAPGTFTVFGRFVLPSSIWNAQCPATRFEFLFDLHLRRSYGTGKAVKRKIRNRTQPAAKESDLPKGLREHRPGKSKPFPAKKWLDQVAPGTEKGIRDTHAWKEVVRQFGLKEARKRLRLGLLTSLFPDINPLN